MDATESNVEWVYNDPALALERSAATGKPLLLYWTAGWCPPCQEMRVTVLRTPEFARESREWVLTELSGDAPDAQVWGERLCLSTYPTMLVLSPAGDEIARLPGGLTSTRFCEVMRATRNAKRSIAALAGAVTGGNAVLSDPELTVLAYHSWRQDARTLAASERTSFFQQLMALAQTAHKDEWARIVTQRVIEESAAAEVKESTATHADLCRQFLGVLSGPAATYANLYYLNVDPGSAVAFLTRRGGVDRALLTAAWSVSIETMLVEETLSGTERLIAHAALVGLSKARTGSNEVSADFQQRCVHLVHELDRRTNDTRERQSVMNMAGHLLRFVGLPQEAYRVFERELQKSADPYYFMPYLADIARECDDIAGSMNWMQRARDEAPGAATRFALSGRYVSSLRTATPQDHERIANATLQALQELEGRRAVFYGVFRRTLNTLVNDLTSWAAAERPAESAAAPATGRETKHHAILARIKATLVQMAAAETDSESRSQLEAAAQLLNA
jgi:hypothetical protein